MLVWRPVGPTPSQARRAGSRSRSCRRQEEKNEVRNGPFQGVDPARIRSSRQSSPFAPDGVSGRSARSAAWAHCQAALDSCGGTELTGAVTWQTTDWVANALVGRPLAAAPARPSWEFSPADRLQGASGLREVLLEQEREQKVTLQATEFHPVSAEARRGLGQWVMSPPCSAEAERVIAGEAANGPRRSVGPLAFSPLKDAGGIASRAASPVPEIGGRARSSRVARGHGRCTNATPTPLLRMPEPRASSKPEGLRHSVTGAERSGRRRSGSRRWRGRFMRRIPRRTTPPWLPPSGRGPAQAPDLSRRCSRTSSGASHRTGASHRRRSPWRYATGTPRACA